MPHDLTASAPGGTSAAPAVIIVGDWPKLNAVERQWFVEVAVGSLGWGARFGEEYAFAAGVPRPDDPDLPSGIAMSACKPAQAAALVATARVLVVIGADVPAFAPVLRAAAAAGLPVVRDHDAAMPPDEHGRAWGVGSGDALVGTIYALLFGETPTLALPTPYVANARVDFEPPEVTVVIPSYNRAQYVAMAVSSALAQRYPHVKVLVADDGSTDGTANVIAGLDSKRVELLRKPHAGGPDTRNLALQRVTSPFVMWLGDDDVLVPSCVESRVRVHARHPDADVIHGDMWICDATLKPTGRFTSQDWYGRGDALIAALFERNQIADGGALIRFDCFAKAGGYDVAFPKAHDYDFWSRLAGRAVFNYDENVGYLWRWHGRNMGVGSGVDPYADAHVRITLGMWARFGPQRLFPQIPWDALDGMTSVGLGAFFMARRLVKERAWAEAARFAETAMQCWPHPDAMALREQVNTELAGATAP
jgi:hypothetical protein